MKTVVMTGRRRLGNGAVAGAAPERTSGDLWSQCAGEGGVYGAGQREPRLEGVPLLPELRLTADMVCLTEAELVVVAVPSYAVRETAHAAALLLRPGTLLVTAAKGIERDTHLRMSQILEQETGGAFPIAALSGPSHAEEVGRGLPHRLRGGQRVSGGCPSRCRTPL